MERGGGAKEGRWTDGGGRGASACVVLGFVTAGSNSDGRWGWCEWEDGSQDAPSAMEQRSLTQATKMARRDGGAATSRWLEGRGERRRKKSRRSTT